MNVLIITCNVSQLYITFICKSTYWVTGNTKTSYYELNSIYGHDTFMLDVNNVGTAVKVCNINITNKINIMFYICTHSGTFGIHTRSIA